MKKIILFLNCILNISLITAGFTGDTLIKTPKGLVALQSLKVGDKVIPNGNGLFESRDAWLDDHERTELRNAEFKDNQRAFNAHRAKPRTISLSHILLKIIIDNTIKVVTSKPVVNAAKNCCNFFISKIMQPFEKTPEISFDISKCRIDINNILPGWQNNDVPQDTITRDNKTVLKLCLYIYSIIPKEKKKPKIVFFPNS